MQRPSWQNILLTEPLTGWWQRKILTCFVYHIFTEWQYINFIDFEEAYDKIHRDYLFCVILILYSKTQKQCIMDNFKANFLFKVVDGDDFIFKDWTIIASCKELIKLIWETSAWIGFKDIIHLIKRIRTWNIFISIEVQKIFQNLAMPKIYPNQNIWLFKEKERKFCHNNKSTEHLIIPKKR